MFLGGNLFIYGILFIAVGVVWLFLAGRWIFRDRYIRYVLTTMRVMRVRGFIKRENAWIPLSKVTDVRYNSSLIGRTFGFAEIRIDSANEESGLKYMRNLDDPETFYEKLLLLVELKQGNITLETSPRTGRRLRLRPPLRLRLRQRRRQWLSLAHPAAMTLSTTIDASRSVIPTSATPAVERARCSAASQSAVAPATWVITSTTGTPVRYCV